MISKLKKLDVRVVVGGLIVVGGILWLLAHSGNRAVAINDGVTPDSSQPDTYPNAGTTVDAGAVPLPLSPVALTYNIGSPSNGLATIAPPPKPGTCSCDSGCGSTAIVQSVKPIAVPTDFIESQLANLNSV